MSWCIRSRPEVEQEIAAAAAWYEERQPGLGDVFIREAQATYRAITENPFLNSRKHPGKPIRWRRTGRFPYRIIYELLDVDKSVVVIAVLHSARHDSKWQRRVE